MANLQSEINRAQRARDLLNNDLLVEAFSVLNRTYLDAWRAAPVRDTEGRESLWHMVKALDAFRGHLESAVETGRMAESQLADLRRNPQT